MPYSRLHKNLNPATIQAAGEAPATPNLFDNVLYKGQPLEDLTSAARRVNPNWPAYESDICVETFTLDHVDNNQFDTAQLVVLRGTLYCCCTPYCNYPGHSYAGGGAFATAAQSGASMSQPAGTIVHNPGQDYVEAVLDLNTMKPIKVEATTRLTDDAERAAFAAEIKAEADGLTLTAEDIAGQLGVSGVDNNGRLSNATAAADVLAGTSTTIDDYMWVAAVVLLFQKLVQNVHTKMTKDWPQRGTYRSSQF